MNDKSTVLDTVRSALHNEPRGHPSHGPIHLAFANGELTMDSEVDQIAGKKLALEAVARVPGVDIIIDRLRSAVRATTGPRIAACRIRRTPCPPKAVPGRGLEAGHRA